jgi:hypothetical protein
VRDLRILKFTNSTKFLALNAPWIIWVTLDLLLSTSYACNRKPFSWLPCLCYTPVCIDSLSIYMSLAMGSIVVKVAKSFARNLCLPYETGQKLSTSPDLRAKTILGSSY